MRPDLWLSYRPAPPLDRFVDRLWYWEGAPPTHGKDRLMPTGTASLIVNLAEDQIRSYSGPNDALITTYPGAVLVGTTSRYAVIDSREQQAVLGVEFLPGGMAPLFNPAADELRDVHTSLRDLWGTHGDTLRERVLRANGAPARLRVVEQELQRRLRPFERRAEVDFLIARLSQSPEHSIARLSERTGLGERRLSRLFAIETGLTPKAYARVKRFGYVLQRLQPDVTWSDLAQRCGYFDQSHLIRDCREISGFTPTQLLARRSGNTRHVTLA